MKTTIALLFAFASVQPVWAQIGRIPQKQTQGYAKLCATAVGELAVGGVATQVDPLKAWAEQGEGGGAMVIPDKTLSVKAIKGVGSKPIPVGQLWLRKWTIVVNGKPAPRKLVRKVIVNLDDKDRPMSLYVMAIRKDKKNGLELVLFGENPTPVQTLPLKALDVIPELPLQLEWRRGEKQDDPLTLSILGRYQAELRITRLGR